MHHKHAFVSSLTAIVFITLMVLLWNIVQQSAIAFEETITDVLPIASSGYIFENVFEEVNKIMGPSIAIDSNNVSFIFSFSQRIPVSNISANMSVYQNFLALNYSSRLHANLSGNFSNITDGTIDLIVMNDYRYWINNSVVNVTEILFNKLDNQSTDVTRYDINITNTLVRQSVTDFVFDPSGDMNVSVTYSDNNGTTTSSGLLRSGVSNTFSIRDSANQTTNITLGSVGVQIGALRIIDTAGTAYNISFRIPVNASKRLSIGYEALLNYSQAQVTKVGLIQKG